MKLYIIFLLMGLLFQRDAMNNAGEIAQHKRPHKKVCHKPVQRNFGQPRQQQHQPQALHTAQPSSTHQLPKQKEFMAIHNRYRAMCNVAPLEWDQNLANSAKQWAQHLADTNAGRNIYHSHKPGVGENIFWGYCSSGPIHTLVDAANGWASEKKLVKGRIFSMADANAGAGHYTQMVWRNTTKVGAAIVTSGGNVYIVAHYSPQGNYLGQKIY